MGQARGHSDCNESQLAMFNAEFFQGGPYPCIVKYGNWALDV